MEVNIARVWLWISELRLKFLYKVRARLQIRIWFCRSSSLIPCYSSLICRWPEALVQLALSNDFVVWKHQASMQMRGKRWGCLQNSSLKLYYNLRICYFFSILKSRLCIERKHFNKQPLQCNKEILYELVLQSNQVKRSRR